MMWFFYIFVHHAGPLLKANKFWSQKPAMVSHGLIHTFGCHRMRGESTVEWCGKDELENDMQKDLVT